jgi:hypothetical protein
VIAEASFATSLARPGAAPILMLTDDGLDASDFAAGVTGGVVGTTLLGSSLGFAVGTTGVVTGT